ncbi:hypothetical protein S83_061964 [Arachis hypogaea]
MQTDSLFLRELDTTSFFRKSFFFSSEAYSHDYRQERIEPKACPRNIRKKCCFRSRPDQIKGGPFFFFLKERKFTGGWVLFRCLLPHIKVTGFEPMALCTQNRCADQTALHLVSPPSAYRSTRSMKTRTELAHPFGHRDARTNPSNQPLFLENLPPASHPNPTAKKPYSAGALTFWLPLSFTFIFENPARSRLPVLWTQSPLRSGFEPLTQGFSVLCSNQLSYLNHFPKVCFLHRIAPYLTYHFTS